MNVLEGITSVARARLRSTSLKSTDMDEYNTSIAILKRKEIKWGKRLKCEILFGF